MRTGRWLALGLWLVGPILFAHPLLAQTADVEPSPGPQHKVQKQLVLPPMPSGPLSQLPMDQIPPTPAKVIFEGGLLTISAQNATLGEILREVRRLTGASIEIPAGAGANEHVVTSLGPGAPREVLAVLLNGSSFNYVMTGSNTDPSAVSSVVLMSKPPAPGGLQPAPTPTVAENVYQSNPMPPRAVPFMRPNGMNQPQPVPQANAQPDAESDDSKDDEAENADEPEDQAQQVEQGDAAAAQEQQTQGPNQPNAGPKTPEQILEMLRKQQQQQQQQPGAVPPQPVPPQIPPQPQPPEQ